MAIISVPNNDIFLIKFLHQPDSYIVCDNGDKYNQDFKTVLQTHDKNGIESIQWFSHKSKQFVRINKAVILNAFKYNTETSEYLKTHYLFK